MGEADWPHPRLKLRSGFHFRRPISRRSPHLSHAFTYLILDESTKLEYHGSHSLGEALRQLPAQRDRLCHIARGFYIAAFAPLNLPRIEHVLGR